MKFCVKVKIKSELHHCDYSHCYEKFNAMRLITLVVILERQLFWISYCSDMERWGRANIRKFLYLSLALPHEFEATPMNFFDFLFCFLILHSQLHDFYSRSLMLNWKNFFEKALIKNVRSSGPAVFCKKRFS